MWKMPIRLGRSRLYGKAAGMLPALDPPPRPYSPPSADTANTRGGCAIGRVVQTPPHRLAGQAGSRLPPATPQFRFVSLGPRYPSGRIPQCDASAAPEVVLTVASAQLHDAHAVPHQPNALRPCDATCWHRVLSILVGIRPQVQYRCARNQTPSSVAWRDGGDG